MNNKRIILKNEGFTLVEVVVVVVILVILATIGIPAYTKYFKSSYNEKVVKEAQDILESAQIVIDGLYAESSHSDGDECIITGKAGSYEVFKVVKSIAGDCSEIDLHKNKLAEEILKIAGYDISMDDPCGIALGLGNYKTYGLPTSKDYSPEKAYKIYYILIWPYFAGKAYILRADNDAKLLSKSIYVEKDYPNNEITKFDDARNTKYIIYDGEVIKTQLYYIKNGKGNDTDGNNMWGNITGKIK